MSAPCSICIVEDGLPWNKEGAAGRAMDKRALTALDLKFLVETVPWDEEALKDLVANLISESQRWDVRAFVNPKFYLEYSAKSLYFPEVIVFDWNYSDYSAGEDSEQFLKKILSKSSAAIGIFTNEENAEGVRRIIDGKLGGDAARVKVVEKGLDSYKTLVDTVENLRKDNFTVRYGSELRNKASMSLEGILAEFCKYDVKKLICSLGKLVDEQKYELHTKELTDAIVERLRNELNLSCFANNLSPVPKTEFSRADDGIKEIWRQRLYYSPKDEVVRQGDIIWVKDKIDKLYMVINNTCDFRGFWKKNHGFLTVVPIERMAPERIGFLKDRGANIKPGEPSSLTNIGNSVAGKHTILPFIKISGNEANYLLNPKAITSIPIPKPSVGPGHLSYADLVGYDYQNRLSVSEPFLTPLIQFVLSNISGYGVPDYPGPIKDCIKEDCKSHGE